MKLYFVKSATANNYIMAETENGILCSNCAPDGRFAGVSLYGYNLNGESISGERIARQIAERVDPDISADDILWMGDPCYAEMTAWEKEQDAKEPYNRDEKFLIGTF